MTRRSIAVAVAALSLSATVPPAGAADGPPASAAQTARADTTTKRALDRPLPEVKFNASSLSDVIDFLADASGANFSVDWKALEAAHVAKDAQITLRMSAKVSLRKVLGMVLKQASSDAPLTFYVDQGVIEITSQEASDKQLMVKTYPIQDLLFQPTDYTQVPNLSLSQAGQGQSAGGGGGGASSSNLFTGGDQTDTSNVTTQKQRADEIIKLITDTVKPELWQVNGGTATISFFRGVLIVNAPRSIHEQLEGN